MDSFFTDSVSALSRALVFVADRLRDDKDNLRLIADAMSIPVTICARDLSFRWVSTGITQLLGRPADEIIGQSIVSVLGRRAFDALRPYFERVLAGEYVEYEERVFYKGPGSRWIHAVYTPTFGLDRVADGWVGLIIDIDEQHRAQEKLKESESRFRNLADAVPVLVWMCDTEGQSTFVNARYAEYAGIPASEINDKWDTLIHPEDREAHLRAFQDGLANHAQWHALCRLRRHDGVHRWFETVAVPRYEGERFAGYTGCNFDITEMKEAEDAAIASNRQKDEFIAVLGHEMRNPMAAISSAVEFLEEIKTGDEEGKTARKIIRRQLNHLARLVDDVSDVSRLIAGKLNLVRRPIDLGDAVGLALQGLEASANARLHPIAFSRQGAWVDADPVRLEQIISNLLSNALKFTHTAGKIEVDVGPHKGRAVLTVRDSGIGIPKDFLPRLFQPFAQAQPSFSGQPGGLGLGLTLVKRLVDLHGGEISVESDGPGRGATFVVSFPLIGEPVRQDENQLKGQPAARLRIIIIEDNDDNRCALQALLEIAGHQVESASDAPEGIERALKVSPQIAFVDLALPTWDGYEVARRLREKFGREIRIIAMSGFGREEDKSAAVAAGFDAFLVKPEDLPRLLEILHN